MYRIVHRVDVCCNWPLLDIVQMRLRVPKQGLNYGKNFIRPVEPRPKPKVRTHKAYRTGSLAEQIAKAPSRGVVEAIMSAVRSQKGVSASTLRKCEAAAARRRIELEVAKGYA